MIQAVPEANAIWGGAAPQQTSNIDISVAVATESGLITPIVKNVDTLGLEQISDTVKVLLRRLFYFEILLNIITFM